MRIFLIRHGQSVQNTGENSVLGLADHKVILTEHGKIQARNAAEVLSKYIHQNNIKWRKAKVWYSPFDRTKETMEIFDEVLDFQSNNISISEDIHLTEQQFGLFDGIPEEKWEDLFPVEAGVYNKVLSQQGKFWAKNPMGESPFDVAIRVKEFFGTLIRDKEKHDVDTVFIFTHGVTLRTFTMQWLHYGVDWYQNEKNPGDCWIRLIEGKNDKGYIYKD